MRYLNKDTEDGQTIRMRQWLSDVWVFSVIADKMNLQIEMSSLVLCSGAFIKSCPVHK